MGPAQWMWSPVAQSHIKPFVIVFAEILMLRTLLMKLHLVQTKNEAYANVYFKYVCIVKKHLSSYIF